MQCDICKKEISEPFYITIVGAIVRKDPSFVGTMSFKAQEKREMFNEIKAHKKCWHNLAKQWR